MKRSLAFVGILSFCLSGCLNTGFSSDADASWRALLGITSPESTPVPTATPSKDMGAGQPTPAPTVTPHPTSTPRPTSTPVPTPIPTPYPIGTAPTPIPGQIHGLAPTSMVPGKLQVWTRNAPNVWPSFNNYDTVVFLPADYGKDKNKRYPLVVSLFGIGGSTLTLDHRSPGGNHEGFIKQVWDGRALQKTYPAIVVAPDVHAVNQSGQVWPNATMVAKLIIDTIRYYAVDPNRVVVTGLSAGGSGTDAMMMQYPNLLAGAAVVAYFPPNNNTMTAKNTCPLVHIPIWAAGNGNDGTFSYYNWTHQFLPTISKCPGYQEKNLQIEIIHQTGGHGGWDDFYSRSDVQTWLRSQVKK